jgi:hypothetical protein
MRLNVKQQVLDYEGKPLMTNKTNPDGSVVLGKDNRPIQEPETLRSYLVTALNNKARTETDATGVEEAARRYQLSTKLYAKNEVDVTLAERTLLLERIGALYGDVPLVYGRICDILEEREPELPDGAEDTGVVAKNLDLTNVAPKDSSKPAIQPNKKTDGRE